MPLDALAPTEQSLRSSSKTASSLPGKKQTLPCLFLIIIIIIIINIGPGVAPANASPWISHGGVGVRTMFEIAGDELIVRRMRLRKRRRRASHTPHAANVVVDPPPSSPHHDDDDEAAEALSPPTMGAAPPPSDDFSAFGDEDPSRFEYRDLYHYQVSF